MMFHGVTFGQIMVIGALGAFAAIGIGGFLIVMSMVVAEFTERRSIDESEDGGS